MCAVLLAVKSGPERLLIVGAVAAEMPLLTAAVAMSVVTDPTARDIASRSYVDFGAAREGMILALASQRARAVAVRIELATYAAHSLVCR